MRRTTYHKEFPAGSISSVEELLDLIIEARKEKKAIRIYTVTQSGYLSCFYIMSKTKLYRPGGRHPDPTYNNIDNTNHTIYPIFKDHSCIGMKKTNRRWFKSHEYAESYGIGDLVYITEHRTFTNKQHATNYSNVLKNDPEYIAEVKAWHAYCNKMFKDDLYGGYDDHDWGHDDVY